ncbi:hypothetical protein AMTRI_Chr11g94760 [Amborella trichopoda]
MENASQGLPQTIYHAAHPQHLLVLSMERGNFKCNACCRTTNSLSSSPSYHCVPCNFHLHLHCSSLPKFQQFNKHEHPLTIAYAPPQGAFQCQPCRYDAHVHCIDPPPEGAAQNTRGGNRSMRNAIAGGVAVGVGHAVGTSVLHSVTNGNNTAEGSSLTGADGGGGEFWDGVLDALGSILGG